MTDASQNSTWRFHGTARTRGARSEQDLPHVTGLTGEQRVAFEEENVRKCFAHAREKLSHA